MSKPDTRFDEEAAKASSATASSATASSATASSAKASSAKASSATRLNPPNLEKFKDSPQAFMKRKRPQAERDADDARFQRILEEQWAASRKKMESASSAKAKAISVKPEVMKALKTLGNPSFNREEIRNAYLALALKMHPDKNPDKTNSTKEFQQLLADYKLLIGMFPDAGGSKSKRHNRRKYRKTKKTHRHSRKTHV